MTERQQREGFLMPHQQGRKQAGACLRHEAEIDKRRAEQRARRGKGQVAVKMDRRADANGKPIDA